MSNATAINEESFSAVLKVAPVAILFAACGALSSFWLLPDFPDHFEFIFPLPFALVCTALFMRKVGAVFAIALMDIVWLISSFVANALGMWTNLSPLPGFVGGSIGGFGLVLCAAICHPSAFSLNRVAYGGLIGAIAGLAFTSWTQIYMAQNYGDNINRVFPKTVPILAFALWQAAMGTYLYVIVKESARSRVMQEPSEVL
jgi:hypothetical protein